MRRKPGARSWTACRRFSRERTERQPSADCRKASLRPAFLRIAIIGHHFENPLWRRFAPTKAVKRKNPGWTQYPRATEARTKNPAMARRESLTVIGLSCEGAVACP